MMWKYLTNNGKLALSLLFWHNRINTVYAVIMLYPDLYNTFK